MEFEFDPAKSEVNAVKHGIDFVDAQKLWNFWGFEKELPFAIERRWMRVVAFNDRYWTIIYTLRDDAIRLISVRRARKEETVEHDTARRGNTDLR